MIKSVEPDQLLMQMPSLRAVKAFVAAAKYQHFTRAAESLCVTQAAISRQIKELEGYLGAELFRRVGRKVELTAAGTLFFDAVQLSFSNIAQVSNRIRRQSHDKQVVTVCCTPAFAGLWLAPRLPDLLIENKNIDLDLITTQNFMTLEPGIEPDMFVNKSGKIREGYHSYPTAHDIIYPVCSPRYLKQHPQARTLQGIMGGCLLDLNPYGRSQVAEHVDWRIWFGYHQLELDARADGESRFISVNDYPVLVQLALADQGVALGWHYLVEPLIKQGLLVRPVEQELVHKDSQHFLTFNQEKTNDDACCRVRDWILAQF